MKPVRISTLVVLILTTRMFVGWAQSPYADERPARQWIVTLDGDVSKLYSNFVDNRFSNGGALSVKRHLVALPGHTAIYGSLAIGAYDMQYRVTKEFMAVNDSNSVQIGDINRTFILPIQLLGLWKADIGAQSELFLGTGLEFAYFSPQNSLGNTLPRLQEKFGNWSVGIPFVAQLEYLLSDNLALNFHATYHATFTDHLDNYSQYGHADTYLTTGIGISYFFPAATTDSDYDGLTNDEERNRYHTDPYNADTDGDGLSDGEEVAYKTNPLIPDTDGDGLRDGEEVHRWGTNPLVADTDGDGLGDLRETVIGTSPVQTDTDGDGLNDSVEIARGTDPRNRDTDGDGIPDGLETVSSPLLRDTDGDGLNDADELANTLRPTDEDFDGDGLFDAIELKIGTDPKKPDTDNDGATDYVEYYGLMTDPRNPDTDGDGIPDGSDPTPLGNTSYNPARSVAWTFNDLFIRDEKVDETSKSFILLLHLIRSAPRDMLLEIAVEVYGEDSMTAADRKANLESFLRKLTRTWIIPRITFTASVRASRAPEARLEYEWNGGL